MTESNLMKKMTKVKELVIECPAGDALDGCPAKDVRKLPLTERFNVVEKMIESELDNIIRYHMNCSQERQMKANYRDRAC